MRKKLLIYFFLFVFFIGLNIHLAYKLDRKNSQLLATQKLLEEIDPVVDLHSQFNQSNPPLVLGAYEVNLETNDGRVANLKRFFRKHNSLLYDFAETIVKVSDVYHFDYRLLPAIAMQESNLCLHIPADSHNCWGWGIYGTTVTKFNSFPEAIETVAYGIKKEYIDKGLVTASGIMQKYTPSSAGSWAYGVNSFLKLLE